MALAYSTFWDVFFVLLIWVPLAVLWATALIDIFQRPDIAGWTKALWVTCILVVPFFGALIYMAMRPQLVAARQ